MSTIVTITPDFTRMTGAELIALGDAGTYEITRRALNRIAAGKAPVGVAKPKVAKVAKAVKVAKVKAVKAPVAKAPVKAAKAKAPAKPRKAGDPVKAARAAIADGFGPRGTTAWWTAYRASKTVSV